MLIDLYNSSKCLRSTRSIQLVLSLLQTFRRRNYKIWKRNCWRIIVDSRNFIISWRNVGRKREGRTRPVSPRLSLISLPQQKSETVFYQPFPFWPGKLRARVYLLCVAALPGAISHGALDKSPESYPRGVKSRLQTLGKYPITTGRLLMLSLSLYLYAGH